MLFDDININVKDFHSLFFKKFTNFCKKAPILMSFGVTNDRVRLYAYDDDGGSKVLFDYDFDYRYDVKENIYRIRKRLVEKHYPIMVESVIEKKPYTAEELNQLVSEGKLSIDDVDKAYKIEEIERNLWRIERVIVLRDELFVRNLTTNQLYQYRMKTPVTLFLKSCRHNFTPEEAWEYFSEKSIFLREISENASERSSNSPS